MGQQGQDLSDHLKQWENNQTNYKKQELLRYWSGTDGLWHVKSRGKKPRWALEFSQPTVWRKVPKHSTVRENPGRGSRETEVARAHRAENQEGERPLKICTGSPSGLRASSNQCPSVWKLPEARVRATGRDGRKNSQTGISSARVKSSLRKKDVT